MDISKEGEGELVTISLCGRLDTTTAPVLEDYLITVLPGVKELTFDLKELEYISSAGLRILLSTQKKLAAPKKMCIINVSEAVNEVFEITGFSEVLSIR